MTPLVFLIVDDDDADRRMLGRLLARIYPDSVVHASDGSDLSPEDIADPPDVALIDYGLPGVNGIELMQDLRQFWPAAAFLITTGQGDEEIAKEAIRNGALDYIPKRKIGAESLQRMVGNALSLARMHARMAEQQQELEIFADVMVHDLKSPIRSVDFLVEELALSLEEGDAEATGNVMRLIRDSMSRMGSLVDSLACHVLTTKQMSFEQASLHSVVKTALNALKSVISESGASIAPAFDDVTLMCCPPQLSQLFQNVIGNAIKYAGEKRPEVRISVSTEAAGRITICIADNGIGIPPEFQDRAFEPFKRAPGASSSVAGTGLGLATCRKVAQRHGGRIWCESELGVGTTIFLSLPVEEESTAKCGAAASSLH